MLKYLTQTSLVGKDDWVSQLTEISKMENAIYPRKAGIEYLNMATSFDIETSSFYNGVLKTAIMYIWSVNFNGWTFIGRTWEEFIELLDDIQKVFNTHPRRRRVVMYVHNLEYEFQFMCKWLTWFDIFSDDARKPIYAVTDTGIEFRCSYKLSGYSLAKLPSQLKTYKTQKMVGDLDYSLIRHSKTPLTEKEMKYVTQDTQVVVCYIQEQIEQEKFITKIPYTRTGYVRRYCRQQVLGDMSSTNFLLQHDASWRYHNLMKELTLTFEEYVECKRAFQGGFTHANARYVGKTVENVGSIDFTSSYPAWIVLKYFPMSRPSHVKVESMQHFKNLLRYSCCIFDIEFTNIHQINPNESPISLSRCSECEDYIVNNGRVVSASRLTTTITELDFETISYFYVWDSIKVANMMVFRRGYLPDSLILSVLNLYSQKTTLKGVKGREFDYLISKAMLNSVYGMMVTDIVRDNAEFSAEMGWYEDILNSPKKQIELYNKNFGRFLYYPWGIWVTAHARHELFKGILAFGDDYIYSDTDSIKARNMDKHMDFVKDFNADIVQQIKESAWRHQLPEELYMPKTIKGEEKVIGQWDYEGQYQKFKTLGAKRYLVEKDNDIQFTVAGIKKASIKNYMLDNYQDIDSVFENFTDKLSIPAEATGKLTHTYMDSETDGYVTDYLGNTEHYYEKSYIHLEPAPFHLNIIDEFKRYLQGVVPVEE